MTNVRLPRLMDAQMKEITRIRPEKLSITQSLTPLSTAEMTVPAGVYPLQTGQFVELYDPTGSAGIYRITEVETTLGQSLTCKVSMEHAMVTLADKVLFGYTELGGAGMSTGEVLAKLLAEQELWVLGECDAADHFAYSFENENLLTAILSLTGPMDRPMMWTFDFNEQPWKLNLKALSTLPRCECRAGRSLQSARITMDRTDLCTRLYPLGYGEGVDQLRIGSVTGGADYIDADTADTWGIAEMVYAEPGITDAGTLLAAARTVLEKLKNPVVTARLEAAELTRLTGERMDCFRLGDMLRLPLHDAGFMLEERIITLKRPDVFGSPDMVEITLANRPQATHDELARLARRSMISDVYSQGAASEYGVHFGDNCDAEHPAELKFFIDEDAVHVNKVDVRFEVERFRGYARGAAAGGQATATSEAGGEATITQAQKIVTTEASTGAPIAGQSGATTGNTGFAIGTSGDSMGKTGSASAEVGASSLLTTDNSSSALRTGTVAAHTHGSNGTASAGEHSHTMAAHTHGMSHSHTSPVHSHNMSHYHNFSHMHGVTVNVTIPEMPLEIPAHKHSVNLPTHRHDPELGIMEADALAQKVTITVDGMEVPESETEKGEFDAVRYLKKDGQGRISRGAWHVIRFTPDTEARIVADLHVRTFIRSLTGALM